ncbi:MAG: hypothetical protein WEH44_00865 [Pirellulaceae bacterium]
MASFHLRAADEGDESKKAPSSLDQQLLEGLEDEPAPQATSAQPEPRRSTDKSPLDEELFRDLGGEDSGEDIAAPSASPDPLVAIGRQMRGVESRLMERKLDDQTRQMQQKVLNDLAVLMQECKKQCQGGGSGKPGSKAGKPGKGSQAGSSPAGQAPSDSSEQRRDRATERGDKGGLANAMKESWGNLPEHARKHLSNVNADVFLPKYELMLEKYFKRLGEEAADRR